MGGENHFSRGLDLLAVRVSHRLVARKFNLWRPREFKFLILSILGNVYQNRAWTTGSCKFVGRCNCCWNFRCIGDQEAVLGDWHCDTNDVCLLESVGSNRVRVHLTGNCKKWDRVHHGVHDRGHQVGSARSTRCDADAELAAGSGVAFGSVTGTLLVAHQNVADLFAVHQWVIGGENCSTWQTEDSVNPQHLKRADDCLCSGEHFLRHWTFFVRGVQLTAVSAFCGGVHELGVLSENTAGVTRWQRLPISLTASQLFIVDQ